jgi:hypothetical protein
MLSDGTELADYGSEFQAFSHGEPIGFCYLRLLFIPPRQLLQQIGYIKITKQKKGYGPAMYLLCFERAERLDAVHISDKELSDEARTYWERLASFSISVDNAAATPRRAQPSLLIKLARFYVDTSSGDAATTY